MSGNIEQWLNDLGLGKYARAFAEHDIEPDVLPHLTEEHLKELGVSIGHRVRLMKAIEALDAAPAKVSEAAPRSALAVTGAAPGDEAERRQLTVMFCDLVGSTELSTRLDPEDLQDVIRGYQDAVTKVILEFDGFIAKYMGDGVLVYFGYPQAHEDDAERAVRTALAIIDAMPPLNDGIGRAKGVDLAAHRRDPSVCLGLPPGES